MKGRRITIEEACRKARAQMEELERLVTEDRARDAQRTDDGEAEQLRELIRHCWVHSAYSDCGFRQMDGPMRDLYCEVIGRPDHERGDR